MKRVRSLNARGWGIVAWAATVVILASMIIVARAGDGKAGQSKALTGEDLYKISCNRCHAERYAREFTPAQWQTLMTHMRVRGNLPATQTKKILKYLQEESGN